MNVKCPKCRLWFEVPASPGMIELQCNCPRCGTPFTYAVGEAQSNRQKESETQVEPTAQQTLNQNDTAVGQTSDTDRRQGFDGQRRYEANGRDGEKNTATGAVPPPFPHNRTSNRIPSYPQMTSVPPHFAQKSAPVSERRNRGCCLKWFLFIFLFIALSLALIINQCGSSNSYTSDSLGMDDKYSNGIEIEPAKSAPPVYKEETPRGSNGPSWIQGNWHVDTEYGGISLKIHGNNIAETSGGETSYGTFEYRNHRLYCDFGDNNTFVYTLVEETRQIDAGNGILMSKTD